MTNITAPFTTLARPAGNTMGLTPQTIGEAIELRLTKEVTS
jgi:hypothetical protein